MRNLLWAALLVLLGMPLPVAAASAGGEPVTGSICAQLARLWKTPGGPQDGIHLAEVDNAPQFIDPLHEFMSRAFERKFDDTASEPVFDIERLAGTPVVRGVSLQGSRHCVYSIYAMVEPDGRIASLPSPPSDTGTCLLPSSERQGFGTVLAQPAHIEYDEYRSTRPMGDDLIRVTPWAGDRWGQSCQLSVQRRYEYTVKQRNCRDQAVCDAAGTQAQRIAPEYLRQRSDPVHKAATIFFGNEAQADDSAVALAWRILHQQSGGSGSAFEPPGFPNVGCAAGSAYLASCSLAYQRHDRFVLFRWVINGHTYVGAAGRAQGPSWSMDEDTLLAIYAAPKEGDVKLVPLAGFVIEARAVGVERVEATTLAALVEH